MRGARHRHLGVQGRACAPSASSAVIVHAQIHATGDWRTLCAYDQKTGRERYDDSNRSDHEGGGGRGRTSGGHSRSNQEDQPEDEEEEGGKGSGSSTGLAAAEAEEEEGEGWGGWTALGLALLAAAVIGGLGYWWFFVRGSGDRDEYQQVPGRV